MVKSENVGAIIMMLGIWWLAVGQFLSNDVDAIATGVILIVLGLQLIWNEIKKYYVFKSDEDPAGRIKSAGEQKEV